MFEKKKVEDYKKLFASYGFTVKQEEEDLIVENDKIIGAFTVREDGLAAGAFFNLFRKEELMKNFEVDKAHTSHKLHIGWFFYDAMRSYGKGYGNHDFSLYEVEWYLQHNAA